MSKFINKTTTFGSSDYIFGNVFTKKLSDGENEVNVSDLDQGVKTWASNTEYKANTLVYVNEKVYICKVTHTSTSNFTTDLIAGDWQVVANSVSNNMIQDTLYEGEITTTGTYTLNYDVSNYEYVIVTYGQGDAISNTASQIIEKENFTNQTILAIGVWNDLYSVIHFSSNSIIVEVVQNRSVITKVTGIRKETFNTAYTGTTYKTLWDSSKNGLISTKGTTYTLEDNISNYDFICISHYYNTSSSEIQSNMFKVSDFINNQIYITFGDSDIRSYIGCSISGNTLEVKSNINQKIVNITGIKVNGYTLDYLAELAAPSDIYENITALPYTAPADGYIQFSFHSTNSSNYISLKAPSDKLQIWCCVNDSYYYRNPLHHVKKGDTISINGIKNTDINYSDSYFFYSVGSAKQLGLID